MSIVEALENIARRLRALETAEPGEGVGPGDLPAHASRHELGGDDVINVGGLSGLLADAQTPLAHALVSAYHTAAGLTIGHVVRASGAATFAWAQLQHGDLGGIADNQHHDPISLAVSAAVLLDLTGQQLSLDSQAANRVLAGPASGAAAAPTFRTLVREDYQEAVSRSWMGI